MPSISQIPKLPKNTGGVKTPGLSQNRMQNIPGKPTAKNGQSPQQSPNKPQSPQQSQQKSNDASSPGQIANQISGGGGGSAPGQMAKETQQRTMSVMMAIPEAAIMLPIAIMLDAIGLLIFILDFVGIGVGLSFIPDILGIFSIGFWILIRSFFRGITQKAISAIENKVSNGRGQNSTPTGPQGGKVAKKGIKAGLSITVWLVMTIVELIPFVGDLVPGWTISVIYELIQGEIK